METHSSLASFMLVDAYISLVNAERAPTISALVEGKGPQNPQVSTHLVTDSSSIIVHSEKDEGTAR